MTKEDEPKIRPTGFEATGLFLTDILGQDKVKKLEEKYKDVEGIMVGMWLSKTGEEGEESEEVESGDLLLLRHDSPEDAKNGIAQVSFNGSEQETEEIIKILASS